MSMSGSEKENTEKLAAAMWMYATQVGSLPPTVRKLTPPARPARPIMLIPASTGSTTHMATTPSPLPGMMLPPPMLPYRGIPVPYMRPGSVLYAHPHPAGSLPGTYRTHRSSKSSGLNGQHRRRRAGQCIRANKVDANRRQRCKSEADIVDGQAFQYTGLDRAIADNFLARQEQSNASSHIDYSSSSSAASDNYGKGGGASRSSSTTKIICRDVVM